MSLEQALLRILSVGTASTLPVVLLAALGTLIPGVPRRFISTLWKTLWVRLLLPFSVFDLLPLLPSGLWARYFETGGGLAEAVSTSITGGENVGAATGRLYVLRISALVWAFGTAVMLAALAIRLIAMKKRLSTATLLQGKVYQSDRIDEPIVFGLLAPKIYLPYSIGENGKKYALLHESAHLRRRDDLWLLLGRIVSAVYWFCPFVWLAYAVFRREIELACDETVSRPLSMTERSEYCAALLNCSVENGLLFDPTAHFGGENIKRRIRYIMKRSSENSVFVLLLAAVFAGSVACTYAAPVVPLAAARSAGNRAEKNPEYKNMDISSGVLVLAYKMSPDDFSCIVIPAKGRMEFAKTLNLHSLTPEEVVELLDSLGVDDSAVTVHPYRSLLSSCYYIIDNSYFEAISQLFGGRYAVGEEVKLRDIADIPN